MKCKKCHRELEEYDTFCGFCGEKIKQNELDVSDKKKSGIGVKIFVLFSIISIIAGMSLGFCVAHGIISWEGFDKKGGFKWTSFSEAEVATGEHKIEEMESGETKEANE